MKAAILIAALATTACAQTPDAIDWSPEIRSAMARAQTLETMPLTDQERECVMRWTHDDPNWQMTEVLWAQGINRAWRICIAPSASAGSALADYALMQMLARPQKVEVQVKVPRVFEPIGPCGHPYCR